MEFGVDKIYEHCMGLVFDVYRTHPAVHVGGVEGVTSRVSRSLGVASHVLELVAEPAPGSKSLCCLDLRAKGRRRGGMAEVRKGRKGKRRREGGGRKKILPTERGGAPTTT